MEHHSPEHTANNPELPHLRPPNYSRRTALRNLVTATAIGCFAIIEGDNVLQKKHTESFAEADTTEALLPESICLNQIVKGESLLNRLLHVTIDTPEGPREIPFRVMHDRGEIVICMDNGVFRSCNSIVGIGKISGQISDVTAQQDAIRLHSSEYGHADIQRDVVANVLLFLDAAPPSEPVLRVQADARYVPVEGSPIHLAHTMYQSISGVFDGNYSASDKSESSHKLIFLRDQPERIAHLSR